MSVRALGTRLFKHGTSVLRHLYRRDYNTSTISGKVNPAPQTGPSAQNSVVSSWSRSYGLRNVGLQVGIQARRLFVDNVLNRVTNSLSSELRRKATRRLLFGDSGPFFALVGVSLASGTGILTKDDELEGVCWEIREAVSKLKWNVTGLDCENRFENEEVTLKDLSWGMPIAKGASGVVYSAKIQESSDPRPQIQHGSNDATKSPSIHVDDSLIKYPLALKMMFNYDIESNSMAILRAMYHETIPARKYYSVQGVSSWEMSFANRKPCLPVHPNIVAMHAVFTDAMQNLPNAFSLYPDALPARINPDGYGRNMTLFLLMKRYHCSLQEYLKMNTPNVRLSVLMLTQLLEGVIHLNIHGIAHRDLKSDNILIDLNDGDTPILVITDFGCCLADTTNGLDLPFNSLEINRGGNMALMAPEVITQTPGVFNVINYSKADLWASGTIAYEIFGLPNPFYCVDRRTQPGLRNVDYADSDLPPLPQDVPPIIKLLIENILSRNPRHRLKPEVACNVCQLFLWAPSSWLRPNTKVPRSTEILQWLLCLTTKILCEGRLSRVVIDSKVATPTQGIPMDFKTNEVQINNTGRRTYPEYLLISSFLGRARLCHIRSALHWIQEHV